MWRQIARFGENHFVSLKSCGLLVGGDGPGERLSKLLPVGGRSDFGCFVRIVQKTGFDKDRRQPALPQDEETRMPDAAIENRDLGKHGSLDCGREGDVGGVVFVPRVELNVGRRGMFFCGSIGRHTRGGKRVGLHS